MSADTYSTDGVGVLLMGTGNDNNSWGDNANTSVFQIIMDAIANVLTSAVTGGTLTLSASPPPAAASQTRYAALKFTGILGSNQTVEVPNLNKWWLVQNATSGAFTLKFKTSGGSASTAIPQNSGWQMVRCDGANAIEVWPFNTAQIQMPDGTVGAPAYSNLTEPTSGWWRAGTQDWRLSINGVDVLKCTGTGAASASIINVLSPNALQVNGVAVFVSGSTIKSADGTVGAPGVSFNSEATSGLYRIGSGSVGYAILGAKITQWTAAGFQITGTLAVSSDFAVATNKFTVAAASGNTDVAGTFHAVGAFTFDGSGAVAGTLGVTGILTANNASGIVAKNVAKAFGSFTVSGGVVSFTSGDAFNVSGVVRNSTGNYTVTFANAMANTTYAASIASFGGNCLGSLTKNAGNFVFTTVVPENIVTARDTQRVEFSVFDF